MTVSSVPMTPSSLQVHPITAMASDLHDTGSMKSNAIITELNDDRDSADDFDQKSLTRRSSMSTIGSKEILSRTISNTSRSTESPSLPKRNQTITSSAPSTLNKAKPEEKTGEVYV